VYDGDGEAPGQIKILTTQIITPILGAVIRTHAVNWVRNSIWATSMNSPCTREIVHGGTMATKKKAKKKKKH
jgi:hypothetical protein